MKKKLLLSFAVFATALSVNAQTKNVKSHRGFTPVTTESDYTPVKIDSYDLNSKSKNKETRGSKTVVDTLKLVDAKAAYGTGNSYTRYTLMGVPKNADTTFYFTLVQSFPSKADIKVKSAGVVLLNGKKKDSVSVDVDFYGKGQKWMAKVKKKIAVSASPGIYYFNLPQNQVFNTDTLTIEVSGSGPSDSVKVLTTNSLGYGNQPNFVGSIVGDSLTVSSYGSPTKFYPVAGQVISGVGITDGTKLVSFNSKTGKWKISVVHPNGVPSGTAITATPFLKYGVSDSKLGVIIVPNDKTKQPSYYQDEIYWNADYSQSMEADVYIYPVVEYTYNTNVVVDNKCLGENKTVNVTLSGTENIVKNPLFNRAAFDIVYRKLNKTQNYWYTYIGTSSDKQDNFIDGSSEWKFSKTYLNSDVNDTLFVNEYLITWNTSKADYYNKTANTFLISSKVSGTTASTAATFGKADGTASVIAAGGFSPYTYAWNNTATTSEITVAKGDYTVVVTDVNGCTGNASVTVAEKTNSIQDLAISSLAIFPNPVANELNVKFNANSNATIELVNVSGQVIDSKVANQFANVTFNTSALNAGVYFVNIKVAEGTFTQKIIKE